MNENQTLEMQIKASADQAITQVDKLISNITNVGNQIKKVTTNLDANGKVVGQTITSINKEGNKLYTTLQKIDKDGSLKSTTTSMKLLGKTAESSSTKMNKFINSISLTGLYLGVKRLTTQFLGWMDLAIDRTEQLNLFNVVFDNVKENGVQTFSELGKSATKFQNELNETFGTNMTETLKYQALFQSMAENVGIEDSYSAIMSETMTKLTYDLASLYNKSESTVAEALRAGVYAGQTKPLRNYGIDVTQTSMQPILEKLGITDRSIKEMSQAEKEILRYIATLEQAQVAMGDMANTIESPSNQLKIFKQQLVEVKVALSSLFMGLFGEILPYANAFLMVIKELAESLAIMLGIELTDYNSGIASSEDAYTDLEESINGATEAAKELKRQTLGFDQIHNISENKDNSNSLTPSGGIDKRLLDAIKGYDNGMAKVKMKATEIRDRIMDWLGFTKEVDETTGEVSFKLGEGYTNLEKILDLVKYIGVAMLSWKISSAVTNFFASMSNPAFATNFTKAAGLTIFFTSLVLNYEAIEGLLNEGSTWENTFKALGGATMTAAGTFMITKNVKLTLAVTAITLGVEAIIAVKNFWDEMMETIDYYANNDGKITFQEIWDSWWSGVTEIIIPTIGNFLRGVFVAPFQELHKEIKANGGYWESWKNGMQSILNSVAKSWQSVIDKINSAITKYKEYFSLDTNDGTYSVGDLWADANKQWSDAGGFLNYYKEYYGNLLFGKATGGVYSKGSWKNIAQYANGGVPSHGTMFVAGEAGAEIVGNVNGRTEVLNQSQIASAIYGAVVSAMTQSGGTQIDVYVHSDEGVVVDRINKKTKQTGVCPIHIPLT